MNNDQRTPGTWHVEDKYPFDIKDEQDHVIASMYPGFEEMRPNALLLGAATDLEDFAHAFLQSIAGGNQISKARMDWLYQLAERAVMKSKGLLS